MQGKCPKCQEMIEDCETPIPVEIEGHIRNMHITCYSQLKAERIRHDCRLQEATTPNNMFIERR